MPTRNLSLAALLSLLCLFQTSYADVRVTSQESGEFLRPGSAWSEGERTLSASKEKIRPGTRLVARPGLKFGTRFTLEGDLKGKLTYLYLTPGVIHPNGKRDDKYMISEALEKDKTSYVIAFEFTNSWEVTEGTWQLMVFRSNTLVLKESFELVPAATE